MLSSCMHDILEHVAHQKIRGAAKHNSVFFHLEVSDKVNKTHANLDKSC